MGVCPSVKYNDGDKLKLTGIAQFGDVSWATFSSAFRGCSNIVSTMPPLPNGIGTSLEYSFENCGFTGEVSPLPSGIVYAKYAYNGCTGFTSIGDQSASDGTLSDVRNMFSGCTGLTGNAEPYWDWITPPTLTIDCYTGSVNLADYEAIPVAYGGLVDPFMFTVTTDNTGTSNDDQITIPLYTGEVYDFTVWYDGVSTNHTSDTDLTITFPSGAGTYGVRISGTFPRIYFNNTGDKLKLTGLTQFGDVGWSTDQSYAFYNCYALTGSIPPLQANLTNGRYMFSMSTTVTFTGGYPDIPSTLTNGWYMFNGCRIADDAPPLPAGLINGRGMFQRNNLCTGINVGNACDGTLINVVEMFSFCTGMTGYAEQFWNWNTPPVSTAQCYGYQAGVLDDYDTIPPEYGGGGVDNFVFTVQTDNTGTSNTHQFTIPLAAGELYDFIVSYDRKTTAHNTDSDLTLSFTTPGTYTVRLSGTFPRIYFNNTGDKLKLTGITQFGDVAWGANWTGAFYGCSNLVGTVPDLPSGITNGTSAFRACTGVTGDTPLIPNSLSNGTYMFYGAGFNGNIQNIPTGLGYQELMFSYCPVIGQIPSMSGLISLSSGASMFAYCTSLTGTFPDLPPNMTQAGNMFFNCSGITGSAPTIPNSLQRTVAMFQGCTGMTGDVPAIPSSATNINSMFRGCTGLTGTIPDLSANDGILTNVFYTFNGCTNLTGNSEDFWNWATPPTTTTACYAGCTSLTDHATIPASYGGGGA
jgi:hypothetical protein